MSSSGSMQEKEPAQLNTRIAEIREESKKDAFGAKMSLALYFKLQTSSLREDGSLSECHIQVLTQGQTTAFLIQQIAVCVYTGICICIIT